MLVEEGVVKARHAAGLGLGNDDLQGSEAAASRRKGKEPVRVDFEKAQSVESHEVEEELSRSRLAQVIRVMADRTEDGYQWLDGGIAGTALGLVVGAWSEFGRSLERETGNDSLTFCFSRHRSLPITSFVTDNDHGHDTRYIRRWFADCSSQDW